MILFLFMVCITESEKPSVKVGRAKFVVKFCCTVIPRYEYLVIEALCIGISACCCTLPML